MWALKNAIFVFPRAKITKCCYHETYRIIRLGQFLNLLWLDLLPESTWRPSRQMEWKNNDFLGPPSDFEVY